MRVIHVRVMASDYHFDPGSAYLYCCSFFKLTLHRVIGIHMPGTRRLRAGPVGAVLPKTGG